MADPNNQRRAGAPFQSGSRGLYIASSNNQFIASGLPSGASSHAPQSSQANPLRHLLSQSFDNVSGGSSSISLGNVNVAGGGGAQGASSNYGLLLSGNGGGTIGNGFQLSNISKSGGGAGGNSFAGMNNNTYDYHNSVSHNQVFPGAASHHIGGGGHQRNNSMSSSANNTQAYGGVTGNLATLG